MEESRIHQFEDLPQAESCRLIDFDRVAVLTLDTDPTQYFLVVLGTKTYLDVEVDLVPLKYIDRPEWWGIEVVSSVQQAGSPDLDSYVAAIPLAGITGTRGVEVIGATRTDKTEIPPGPGKDT